MTSPPARRSLKARPSAPAGGYRSPQLSPTGPPPNHVRPSLDSLNWEKLVAPPETTPVPNIPTTDQEPICVLKLELNNARGGVKYLKIYERDEPEDIVENLTAAIKAHSIVNEQFGISEAEAVTDLEEKYDNLMIKYRQSLEELKKNKRKVDLFANEFLSKNLRNF